MEGQERLGSRSVLGRCVPSKKWCFRRWMDEWVLLVFVILVIGSCGHFLRVGTQPHVL